jgi:hypothetical protein
VGFTTWLKQPGPRGGTHTPVPDASANLQGAGQSAALVGELTTITGLKVVPSMDTSIKRSLTPTLPVAVEVPMHRRTSSSSRLPAGDVCTRRLKEGRRLPVAGRSPQGGGRLGDGVGVGEGEGVGVLVGVGEGVGVGVGVGVRVRVLDRDVELVGVPVGVGVEVGVGVRVRVTEGVTEAEAEAVTEADSEMVGDGDGDGQFCCSFRLSSPTGPSSMDPRLADMAMQATLGSQAPMSTFTEPSTLLARAPGMRE